MLCQTSQQCNTSTLSSVRWLVPTMTSRRPFSSTQRSHLGTSGWFFNEKPIGHPAVEYFGYLVSNECYRPQPSKVTAIQRCRLQFPREKLCRFLCMITFCQSFIACVYHFSSWCAAFLIPGISAKTAVLTFLLHLVAVFGAPRFVTTAGGQPLESVTFKRLCDLHGCTRLRMTAITTKKRLNRAIYINITGFQIGHDIMSHTRYKSVLRKNVYSQRKTAHAPNWEPCVPQGWTWNRYFLL